MKKYISSTNSPKESVYEQILKSKGMERRKRRWNNYVGKCEICGEPQTRRKDFKKLCDNCLK